MPETLIVESTEPRSGIGVSVLLLNRTSAPATPEEIVLVTTKPPVAAVTVSTTSMFAPQLKNGSVVSWNGITFVLLPFVGTSGYADCGCVMTTPGVIVEREAE